MRDKCDWRDFRDRRDLINLIGMGVWKPIDFITEKYRKPFIFFRKSLKIPPGRAPGAPKLTKMVPRGSWRATRECPGGSEEAKEAKKWTRRPPRTPLGPQHDPI